MKLSTLLLTFFITINLNAQDITFERISEDTIYGNRVRFSFGVEGILRNHTNDSVSVKYVRKSLVTDIPNMYNGLCTDILCYYVSMDTIVEKIPPNKDFLVKSLWQVIDETYTEGLGCVEWEISNLETNDVITEFNSHYIFKLTTNNVDIVEPQQIKVFPNPTSDYIEINQNVNAVLTIYNSIGQQVLHLRPDSKRINVSQLLPGKYYGKVINQKNKTMCFNFIKT